MTDSAFISADEAAAALGITRKTLYAYVSRGLVRSEPGPGPSRARRYPRAPIEALARARAATPGERAAADAMDWGLPIVASQLTLIEDGRLYYRGQDALALSTTASLESVASLLWTDDAIAADALFEHTTSTRKRRPADGTHLTALERHLVRVAHRSLASVSSPPQARLRAAATLVCDLFAAVGATGPGSLAERLARGWASTESPALSAALVLCADHELNVSAFTARCIASADARVEHVVLGALCAFQGRRHGGMGARVHALLDDVDAHGLDRALDRVLAEQGAVPGFGHPLYPDGDPRSPAILRHVARPTADASTLVARRCDELGLAPNLDFALATLGRRLNLPTDAGATIFALGRTVGWIAHAFETWDHGSLMRPRARYSGRRPTTQTQLHSAS
jgi:citrate synthase